MIGGISERLTIGFDMGGDDKACLVVVRHINGHSAVINQFYDSEAEELYEKLAGLSRKERCNGT